MRRISKEIVAECRAQRIEMTSYAVNGDVFDEIGKRYVHFRRLRPPIFRQLITYTVNV